METIPSDSIMAVITMTDRRAATSRRSFVSSVNINFLKAVSIATPLTKFAYHFKEKIPVWVYRSHIKT